MVGGVGVCYADGGYMDHHADYEELDPAFVKLRNLADDWVEPRQGLVLTVEQPRDFDLQRFDGGNRYYPTGGWDRLRNELWDEKNNRWDTDEACRRTYMVIPRRCGVGLHDIDMMHSVGLIKAKTSAVCVRTVLVFHILPERVLEDGRFNHKLKHLRKIKLVRLLNKN